MAKTSIERLQSHLAAARGDLKVDLLIRNARLINVFDGSIDCTSIAVYDGIVVGFGDYESRKSVDLNGAFIAPGFIESHIHIESSKLVPARFSEATIIHGTTTVIADPHEIANVMGIDGILLMLKNSRYAMSDIFYMLPSCVPATHMETSGAVLSADDLRPLLEEPDIIGIGEMMNFPGALFGDPEVLRKMLMVGDNVPIDGHAPGLSGTRLSSYIISGPVTDHECTSLEEAREKLKMGMRIMIREGSTARNLEALLPLVNETTERRMMFVSDDRRPGDLLNQGHLDHTLRKAVSLGLDPVTALRMVTLNPAEAYGLTDRGAIRPGNIADFVVIDDLDNIGIRSVWKGGRCVADQSGVCVQIQHSIDFPVGKSLSVPFVSDNDLKIKDMGKTVRVIGVVPDQIITENIELLMPSENGLLVCDADRDIVKLAVIERYSGEGGSGVGFVRGTGIRNGAIASTVAHDSHNIICAGDNDLSMAKAINSLINMGGGQVVVQGAEVLAKLPLPFAGLMSDESIQEVSTDEDNLHLQAKEINCSLADPFMALSFLALPVIPSLKLTDKGLVDVDNFKLVSLYV